MIHRNSLVAVLACAVAVTAPLSVRAQSVSEDFTSTRAQNGWFFFNGACLTAGTTTGVEPTVTTSGSPPTITAVTSNGQIPGCTTIAASYYTKTAGEKLVGGYNGTFPDPAASASTPGQGALRFTNGYPYGYSENGGVVFAMPFPTGQGVSITFKTVTYLGNSGGAGGDGADGISFFLMDASQLNTTKITGTSGGDGNGLGSWGGSLGYTCSNSNPPYNGLIGAYLGLGIDEFGNFLNGVQLMPGYTGPNSATGDNSQYGYGYKPNRIGLRGAGNIAWGWLNANYPTTYPSSFSTAQQHAAVRETCMHGEVWDEPSNSAVTSGSGQAIALQDYAPIPNAYVELPASTQIANESATTRGAATPILYQLNITQNGLLSLSYSICPPAGCGSYISVITQQDITASNGALPANFLFGFAGSTGGSTNIHEILCFKANPATSASSSAGASERQSAKLETGTQAYFAYYNPSDGWTGRVTASNLGLDAFGNVVIAATPNWDASCFLTGVAAGSTCSTTGDAGPIPAQNPSARVILSWNGNSGIPFEWGNLTTAPAGGQQAVIDAGDATPFNTNRVNYLRGDRTNEINTSGLGLFRRRNSVLADIIDSSPAWVGAPVAPYGAVWSDRLNSSDPLSENSAAAQSYAQYVTAEQSRPQVVYVGSNDGLLHGFRSGTYNPNSNKFINNDGKELLAYMPGAIVQTIHSTTANVDYSNAQYGHNYFVDATPGTGDLFYGGQWHSWLVGGLGPGGAAIYVLDVTNPGNFSESSAASVVVGEWTAATLSCTNVPGCGTNLGNTYGTPQMRRLHDGRWAVIFGNGFGSTTGDAGIYVMLIDPSNPLTNAPAVYYLSTHTGSPGSPNGIAFTTPADLDGDHITDYVYAGDLQGNVWRFDLTSSSESNWALTPGPLFQAPGGQPITTQLVVASGAPSPGMQQQLMILFGTGQKVPLTNASAGSYASGTQSLYGVWDWNMNAWNASSSAQYAALAPAATGLSTTNYALAQANLQAQTVTINSSTQDRDIASNATVCWAGQPQCATTQQFGWYLNLPGSQEQIIFSPELVAQALTVNSIVPANNTPVSCSILSDTGFTYVVSVMNGAAFNQVFLPPAEAINPGVNTNQAYLDPHAIALQTNATGSSFITTNSGGTQYLVYETNQMGGNNSLLGGTLGLNLPPNVIGRRLSWTERR